MPDGNSKPADRAMRLASVQARLARYIQVGDEINAELKALGLDTVVCHGVRRVKGQQEAIAGGLGFQPRARALAHLLGMVQA